MRDKWLQIKGAPLARAFLLQQKRIESLFDTWHPGIARDELKGMHSPYRNATKCVMIDVERSNDPQQWQCVLAERNVPPVAVVSPLAGSTKPMIQV